MSLLTDISITSRYKLSILLWKVVSQDLSVKGQALTNSKNVAGVPDTIFKCRFLPIYIAAELKSYYCKNTPYLPDFYQVTLYSDLVREEYGAWHVRCCLGYRDKVFKFSPSQRIIDGLHSMVDEFNQVRESNFVSGRIRPLHKRMKVRLPSA